MINKEILNIKNKNSQEILLYLQTKNFKKKKLFFDEHCIKNENKISNEDNNENIPPTRMKQFINNLFFSDKNKAKFSFKSISRETKEITTKAITPRFNQTQSPLKININATNSQFSFSDKENVNNNSVNYMDFHLHENIAKNEEISHLYLPKKYKNDEKYKANLYKYLRAECREDNILRGRGIKTKILNTNLDFSKISKKKKVLSVRKKEINKITFFNNYKECTFNLYRDDIIGIDKEWQLPITYQNYDNDIESDEEQINKGKAKMMYDLRIGIVKWSANKNICYNYRYLDAPIDTEYVKKYSNSV